MIQSTGKRSCTSSTQRKQKARRFTDRLSTDIKEIFDPKNPELLGSGWDGIKTTVMLDALRVKFYQNLALGARLLATNEAEIIKDSDTDYF
jgi:predicted NAD-dependent protein-ADP-ribosyltransferase YbiA (DUF1768 family)